MRRILTVLFICFVSVTCFAKGQLIGNLKNYAACYGELSNSGSDGQVYGGGGFGSGAPGSSSNASFSASNASWLYVSYNILSEGKYLYNCTFNVGSKGGYSCNGDAKKYKVNITASKAGSNMTFEIKQCK